MNNMNKFIAIVLFPFFWITMYLSRLIWIDLICTVIEIILNLFIVPLKSLFLIITLPFVLIWEIPVGLVVTFGGAIDMTKDMFKGDIDISTSLKEYFAKVRRNKQ